MAREPTGRRKRAPRPMLRQASGRRAAAADRAKAGYPTAAELARGRGLPEALAGVVRALAGPVGGIALMAACGAALGGCMPVVRPEAMPVLVEDDAEPAAPGEAGEPATAGSHPEG